MAIETITVRVRRRDTLTAIVRGLGFPARDWRRIYDAPYNRRFRAAHPDPNLILPGALLTVPRWSPAQIRDLVRKLDRARATLAQGERVLGTLRASEARLSAALRRSRGEDRALAQQIDRLRRDAENLRDIAADAAEDLSGGDGWEQLAGVAVSARFEARAAALEREAQQLQRSDRSDTPALERQLASLRRTIAEVERGHAETQARVGELHAEWRRAMSSPYR